VSTTKTISATKSAVGALLALALLTPFLYGFGPLLQGGRSDCGMSCCKKGQRCRRPSGLPESESGPGWTAAPACPNGCGQYPGSLTPPLATAAAGLAKISPAASTAPLEPCSGPRPDPAGIGLALFARPPPSL